MNTEFIEAVKYLEKEKGISKDSLIDAIENALVSSYKKNYTEEQNVRVYIDRNTGDINVFVYKEVLDDVYHPLTEIQIDEARKISPHYEVGDFVEVQVSAKDFGRIAAQTAKQVIIQKIREVERSMVFDDFDGRQGEVVLGTVERISNETVFVKLDNTEGLLAYSEQIKGETYEPNDTISVYIMDVRRSVKGPQVFLSRTHPGLVKGLFEIEVSEIHDGIVKIMSISREAGSRTKMAVLSEDPNVDAVGSCVGDRGMRVQAVCDRLGGEKIDIFPWSDDPVELISSALSPAKVEQVIIENAETKSAIAIVPDYQLSLAIGREGQNVRLAARLCGWKIDIKSHTNYYGSSEPVYAEDEGYTEYDQNYEEYSEFDDGVVYADEEYKNGGSEEIYTDEEYYEEYPQDGSGEGEFIEKGYDNYGPEDGDYVEYGEPEKK